MGRLPPKLTGGGIEDTELRVWCDGMRVRIERLDARPVLLCDTVTCWRFPHRRQVPWVAPAATLQLRGNGTDLLARRPAEHWIGTTTPARPGPITATTYLSRPTWKFELAHRRTAGPRVRRIRCPPDCRSTDRTGARATHRRCRASRALFPVRCRGGARRRVVHLGTGRPNPPRENPLAMSRGPDAADRAAPVVRHPCHHRAPTCGGDRGLEPATCTPLIPASALSKLHLSRRGISV